MSRLFAVFGVALLAIVSNGRADPPTSSPESATTQASTSTSLPASNPAGSTVSRAPEPLPMIARSTRSIRTKQAIDRAVKFLLLQQSRDGTWSDTGNADWTVGQTALVTLALLSAGESHQSPQLAKAIEAMRSGKIQPNYATYCVALRICVLAQLPEPSKQQELRVDLQWLQKAMINQDPNNGLYTYGAPASAQTADFSNSQYGVLAAWYATEAGLEIPFSFWRRADNAWRKNQQRDGGWGYIPDAEDGSYSSMTAAGAATLFITNDYLHAHDAYDLFRQPKDSALDRGVQWLGDHFAVDYNVGRDPPPNRQGDLLSAFANPPPASGYNLPYMLFGYERVGEASGLTRLGSHRWFDEGADFLVRTQLRDGSWPDSGSISGSPQVETAYALLFLTRGLSPIAIQKLQFGTRWNNRPRDVADFTLFLRHNTETHFNWQMTSLSASAAELREAPLLYAASDRPMNLTDADRSALKTYLLQGGMFVSVNEGETQAFATSIEKLGNDLFPGYAFRDVQLNDLVYTGNFPAAGGHEPIRVLSNGVRKLMVLFPKGDMSWKFQSAGGSATVKLSPYNALANIWSEASGAADPLLKGESTWIERSAATVDSPVKLELARLQFEGNWDPEPAGWQRLSNLLHNSGDVELQAETVPFARLTPVYPVAHLTDTNAIKLSIAEQAALRKYITDGGLLFFDAAGGSAEAASSIQATLAGMFPGSRNEPLPVDHPIYAGTYPGGTPIDAVTYRVNNHLPATKLPRLRGITQNGKLLAIISNEDISGALVGYSASDFPGYSPESAAELVRAILLWSQHRS